MSDYGRALGYVWVLIVRRERTRGSDILISKYSELICSATRPLSCADIPSEDNHPQRKWFHVADQDGSLRRWYRFGHLSGRGEYVQCTPSKEWFEQLTDAMCVPNERPIIPTSSTVVDRDRGVQCCNRYPPLLCYEMMMYVATRKVLLEFDEPGDGLVSPDDTDSSSR